MKSETISALATLVQHDKGEKLEAYLRESLQKVHKDLPPEVQEKFYEYQLAYGNMLLAGDELIKAGKRWLEKAR